MPTRDARRKVRLAIAECMIECLAADPARIGRSPHEHLVAFAVRISTDGPHRLNLSKIAAMVGLPRNTVRGHLKRLIEQGHVRREGDCYVSVENRANKADRRRRRKMIADAIVRAANLINETRRKQ